jgi:nucleolar MIF4G domain-containing protein 1
LGIKDSYGDKKKKRNGPATRKDRRRDERAEKKTRRAPVSKNGGRRHASQGDDDDEFEGFDDGPGGESASEGDVFAQLKAAKQAKQQPKPVLKKKQAEESESEENVFTKLKAAEQAKQQPKPVNKKRKAEGSESEDDEEVAVRPQNVSKTVKDKLDQDDAEIAALEKKLGLKKGKKLPKSFDEDGLGDLLGDLDEGSADEGKKRKREADEWLRNKRRKAQGLESESESGEDDSELGSEEEDEDMFDDLDEEDSEGAEETEGDKPTPKKRENPYVAPVAASNESQPQKYIPPSLRASSGSESESLTRLRRQAQGHLNKLSEANLVSILAEYEKLYRDYPRQNVTSTLINLLFGMICERSVLQDTFLILHAGFIAAVYKVVGMDFGAELVQKVVETFDARGDERGKFEGKELINLISLLSQLYNFHVISSTLIFDYIRIFLQDITEENTELLLKIIRSMLIPLRWKTPTDKNRFWTPTPTRRPFVSKRHCSSYPAGHRESR